MAIRNVMLDLETFGVAPGCIILSIGACTFDMRTRFYSQISVNDSRDKGFVENIDTLRWWHKQDPRAFAEATGGTLSVLEVLNKFSDWMQSLEDSKNIQIWGNGADFDLPILGAYYDQLDLKRPWAPFSGRCYRTLKTLLPHIIPPEKNKMKHSAIEDAIYQAQHASLLLNAL